ncbi:MAG: hypothetical protein IPM04_14305 [Saprospiraceae bacterium]|nr:hypothetical protein [Candidatus Brachybacter algidus]MBK8748958.1 hypothetical protein [Candidatus Brachybacter algidus]
MKTSGYVEHPDNLALSAEIKWIPPFLHIPPRKTARYWIMFPLAIRIHYTLNVGINLILLTTFAFRLGLLVPITANNRYRKGDALLDLKESQAEADGAR